MNFTDKEIQLARDMKEAGLPFKPQMADWVYVCWKDDVHHVCTCYGSTIISFYNDDINEFDVKDCVWLPMWHQCRKILTESRIYINLDEQFWADSLELCCWQKKESGITFIGSVRADTDLEIMYQAILMWILDAPRVADDVVTGS